MPLLAEIRASLRGAWLLFLDRPEGMRLFNLGLDGFWRSFAAILLVLPLYLVTVVIERAVLEDTSMGAGPDPGAFWFARAVALILNWVAMPLLLAVAARPLGVSRTYVPFIVARNWASVIASVPFALAALTFGMGAAGSEIGSVLTLAALFVVLRYNYIVARRALEAGIGLAVALTIIDLLLSLLIDGGVDRLFAV